MNAGELTTRRTHGLACAAIVLTFAVSRIAVYRAGVRFDVTPLGWYWQFIDPVLLKDRLLESLYYLHIQPPLFNLLLGVNLKLFPSAFSSAMHAEYMILGLTTAIGLYVLLVQLRLPIIVSALTAMLFVVLPPTLLYENWLFYEYPTMTLLILAAVGLHRCLARDSVPAGVMCFLALAGAIYTRTVFQLVWLVPIIGTLLLVKPRRLVIRCCAVPVLLVVLLYAKNAMLFGAPLTSSWFGLHFTRPTLSQLDRNTREKLVADGSLGPIALVDPFAHVGAYARYVPLAEPTGIPVLDMTEKVGGGQNFNAKSYIQIARAYLVEDFATIRLRPDIYLRSVREAIVLFMSPSTDYAFVDENRTRIARYDRFANDRFYFRTPYLLKVGLGIVGAYLFALGYGAVLLARLAWQRRNPGASRLTILFLVFTILYASALSCMTEVGENQRQRFFLDPLVFAVVVAGLRALWLWSRSVIGRARGSELAQAELN